MRLIAGEGDGEDDGDEDDGDEVSPRKKKECDAFSSVRTCSFVVPPHQMHRLRVLDQVREKHGGTLDAMLAAVHEISQEEIIRFRGVSTYEYECEVE
jgi:hypothetical protein